MTAPLRPRLLLVLLALASTPAMTAELKLELPKLPLVLQQSELPLQQRESQPLPAEAELLQKLAGLLNDQKPEQVLQLVKQRYDDLPAQLEAGDPKGEARQRTVAGNLFGPPRPGISAAMMYLVGGTYMAMKNYVPAEAAYKAALSALPDYARVHEALGVLYMVTDKTKEALPHLSKAAQLGLTTPNLFGALGYLNMKLDNPFGAVSGYQNALLLEPDNPQWQQGLLAALAGSKQNAAALGLVEQLLKARPNDPALWVYRSSLELDAGRKQQGLNSIEVAIRLGNDDVANLQVCAALHMEIGSVERAVAMLRAGILRGLDFRFVDDSLRMLAAREQWAPLGRLLDEYKTTTGLNEVQQSRLLLRRASLSQHNNDNAQARTQLQQAVALDPANGEALLALGQLLHKDKNYAQAELMLQRASATAGVAENAQLLLAQVAIDQHNYAKALKLLRDARDANPARSDLGRNIATLESLVEMEAAGN